MRVAVQGCGHGDLDAIYATLNKLTIEKDGIPADLLIICGDFQAIRDDRDLPTLNCPPKYLRMGDFPSYYAGKRTAPVTTIFIGGNHEASAHLRELPYGGWVAPNIYYLGSSGVVRFGGLRLAGISGLYAPHHYDLGYYERPPYTPDTIRSVYHMRSFDIDRLALLSHSPDIFISHEWPLGIYEWGDVRGLLRCKPHFRHDITIGKGIGAAPLRDLLFKLRPKRWFAAHMHLEFTAQVPHPDGSKTDFLALDKCLPGRRHMRIIDIPVKTDDASGANGKDRKGPLRLEYDPEWLAIIKATNPHINFSTTKRKLPTHLEITPLGDVITDFQIPTKHMTPCMAVGRETTLLQTAALCDMLQMHNHWTSTLETAKSVDKVHEVNEDEIVFD